MKKTQGWGNEKILSLCAEYGGALSGEHGIGIEKQAYMPLVFSEDDMSSMKALREAFLHPDYDAFIGEDSDVVAYQDRSNLFNPGKIFPGGAIHGESYGITSHSIGQSRSADVI